MSYSRPIKFPVTKLQGAWCFEVRIIGGNSALNDSTINQAASFLNMNSKKPSR